MAGLTNEEMARLRDKISNLYYDAIKEYEFIGECFHNYLEALGVSTIKDASQEKVSKLKKYNVCFIDSCNSIKHYKEGNSKCINLFMKNINSYCDENDLRKSFKELCIDDHFISKQLNLFSHINYFNELQINL